MRFAYPVRLQGSLDPTTSRWLWLIKWLLLFPHYVVLTFLCLCSALTWIVAFFAILFTGRYPRGLFDFNVGVMRWSWRVSFYYPGVLATDQYPPFTLDDTEFPARLDVAYPEHLNRWLVLVKWLLAVPHLIIVALLVDVTVSPWSQQDGLASWGTLGLISILGLVAVVMLAISGTYPRGLFDLLMGLNRWVYRVWAYMMLMTDEYPPFRLDRGGDEPVTPQDSIERSNPAQS
jgi:hypothetical protein